MTTAQILIEKGGDPNLVNAGEKTALGIATVRGKREVRGYLERKTTNKPKVSPDETKPDIIEAAKHGRQDPSQKDASSPQDGATPLMFAAMTGRLDMAELLVQYGCDINKQDIISGWTALMQATYHGKKQVAMFLLNAGADVSIQAKNGCTAFDMASLIDDVDTELLRMLASKALHVNKVDKTKKGWNKHSNGSVSSLSLHTDYRFLGLHAWWNRMSNRFRNLKLGRTFTNSNRLTHAPFLSNISTRLTLKDQEHPSQESCDLKVIVLAVSTYEAQGFGGSRADHNINDNINLQVQHELVICKASEASIPTSSIFLPWNAQYMQGDMAATGELTSHWLMIGQLKSATASSVFRTMSNTTSPNSSTSGSSSITPQRSSRGMSSSSKGSTTSTSHHLHHPLQQDELSHILKKLSLEKYSPIFEEQEVDMEAFLTLTDDDLKELGIANVDSRRQILKAIRELNSGKGRERQQFVDTMTSFNSTLKARASTDMGTDSENLMSWNIQDENELMFPVLNQDHHDTEHQTTLVPLVLSSISQHFYQL
ncbi:hypothetical protein C0Q70_18663 [Pomacea canaliculata]|uniref:SAM domain-containing protein n=1 Tax=Pomacea canaliculata TaxID=400727 RepID=A0A2T7NH50_POMCA|nr:hypothetical protein C0Q70_18663 [Pomacea canaliculata]